MDNSDPSWLQALTSISIDAVSELDRENAHFEVTEAIVETLEQLIASRDDSDSDDDLPSIRDFEYSLTSPPTTSSFTPSPISPVIIRKSVSEHRDAASDMADWVSVVDTNTPSISNPLNDDSISSLLQKFAHNKQEEQSTPQSLAKQLFKSTTFSLEESAELDWLLSEKGASPPLTSNLSLPTLRLRGTLDWAPPRAQIIYHLHPPATRKTILTRCGYRCAGCGMKIDPALSTCFRYCAYLGKYFCHSCHHEQVAYIPARILHKWDFRQQRVSNFAHNLLEKMFTEPLYCIVDTNYNLYKSVTDMKYSRALRYQLYFLNEYLKKCKNGSGLLESMSLKDRPHLVTDPQLYSLQDLTEVKDRTLLTKMKMLVTNWLQHVDNCALCKVKGFFCELCGRDEVIYPFQLNTTIQCQMCWACFHKACYAGSCPKCARIRSRRSLTRTSDI